MDEANEQMDHPAVTDLSELLREMQPVLHPGEYVFASVRYPSAIPIEQVIGTFREAEGTTVILARETADRLSIPFDYVAAWITLSVHSSLSAVGLTAAVATALARRGISCNIVAGFYHDHLFVGVAEGARAVGVLRDLALSSAPASPPP